MINSQPLVDHPDLLRLMLKDQISNKNIYKPGPYWNNKAKVHAKKIFKYVSKKNNK